MILLCITDKIMYKIKINGMAMKLKVAMSKREKPNSIKRKTFPFHEKFLNFRENKGSSAISKNERTMEEIRTKNSSWNKLPIKVPISVGLVLFCFSIRGMLSQKRALAGVGNPMKESVCLSSRLNFANRYAENTAITKGMKFHHSTTSFFNSMNAINEGASPKLITSARESSSLPMGEDTFNKRAVMPSKKSKSADNNMK